MHTETEISASFPSGDNADRVSDNRSRSPRRWPRCEPAFTHYELGDSPDYPAASATSVRSTPRPRDAKD